MRHISKTAALFGIGALALILAVLGTVAAPGTASADSTSDQSVEVLGVGERVQPDEACTYHTFNVYPPSYYIIRQYASRPGFHWWEKWRATPIQRWEREICGSTITDRHLSTTVFEDLIAREERPNLPF